MRKDWYVSNSFLRYINLRIILAGTIQSANTRTGSLGREIKASLSRKAENANRSAMVNEKDHLLPWGSLIWLRLEPGILRGRVSYKLILEVSCIFLF